MKEVLIGAGIVLVLALACACWLVFELQMEAKEYNKDHDLP